MLLVLLRLVNHSYNIELIQIFCPRAFVFILIDDTYTNSILQLQQGTRNVAAPMLVIILFPWLPNDLSHFCIYVAFRDYS